MERSDLKYPQEVISDIAQEIDMGMTCFFNTDTMEYDTAPGESCSASCIGEYDDLYQEVYDKVNSWEHTIRIEPPTSRQSFMIMERFIENCIPDHDAIKNRLWTAISERKPFKNFKAIIDDSKYREHWFDYKQSQMEQLVLEQLQYPEKQE